MANADKTLLSRAHRPPTLLYLVIFFNNIWEEWYIIAKGPKYLLFSGHVQCCGCYNLIGSGSIPNFTYCFKKIWRHSYQTAIEWYTVTIFCAIWDRDMPEVTQLLTLICTYQGNLQVTSRPNPTNWVMVLMEGDIIHTDTILLSHIRICKASYIL